MNSKFYRIFLNFLVLTGLLVTTLPTPAYAQGPLFTLGNLVWNDSDNNGLLNGTETGFDNVTVQLWSGNGATEINVGPDGALGTADDAPGGMLTSGGGIYTFSGLPAGDYMVRLPAINFFPGGVLRDYRSSTGQIPTLAYEPAPAPDTNTTDSDDNGTETNGVLGLGGYIQTLPITLTASTSAVDFGVNNSPQIDLVVTKTDGQTSYTAGGTLTYTIVVTNRGPADAGDMTTPTPGTGMNLSDGRPSQITSWTWTCASATSSYFDTSTLPPTLVTTAVPPTNYGCNGGTGAPFTDELFLPQLATVTYTVSAQVSPTANGNLSNQVVVIPPSNPLMTDITPLDNVATDTDTNGDVTPPTVAFTSLLSNYATLGPNTFTVTFSEDVSNPAGNTNTDDVTNPANYLLVEDGVNNVFNTTSCVGGLVADDTQINVTSVSYNNVTHIATVNLSSSLPLGKYRLFVCGTTSIVDLALNALGGGVDFAFDLTVTTPSLPKTGFAPNHITSLQTQPTNLAYAKMNDIWLEIPSLNVKTNIVGVPKVNGSWNVDWLGKDTGWLNGTAFPTWDGNSVLTGHVYNASGLPGPFANLKNLKYGDRIIVHLYGQKYIFEVTKTTLVRPSVTSFAYQHLKKNSYLTLITCQGYDAKSDSYLYRQVVRAVLVDVQLE